MAAAEGLLTGEMYHVFLSFRGPDTRDPFVSCLFGFLTAAGLRVFRDDEELRVGESIAGVIEKAIYDSKLFVPVFSKGYASSKWCLKEIAWMADCMKEFPGKKEMLPVFYDVDVSDVKLKTDLYAKALLEHEETLGCETVEKWRKALINVPKVKGWNRTDDKGEWELIERISQYICRRLELKHRILPDNFIGMEYQVQAIMGMLDCGSRDKRILVIHGMGGIGKTTLASAVFNQICWQFKGCSFLSNVKESAAGNGILNLQNKLLGDMFRFSSYNFRDKNDAMNCIKDSLQNKEVLVVLDDVSDKDQIKELIGMGDWVGLGSRVIITTRNFSCVANVEEIGNDVMILQGKKIFNYQMRELGFDNSLKLLCRHAFGQYAPPHGYEQLSHDILSFTKGIPLAIEVIGSYLKGKRVTIWKEMLEMLKKESHDDLYQKILMSTYDMLCDREKEIFLDIAFFFAGHDKTTASYYWKARDLYPEMSIDTLISYALVKIDFPNKLWMHDIIRDLGREVVRKESNKNLGRRSRLCNKDAKDLLSKGKGTEYVKALKLDWTDAHNFTPAQLSGLSDLQFLELCGGDFVGEFDDGCLSELRWLAWRYCPLDFGGTNFCFENLVVLRLSESEITDTWAGWEQLKTAMSLKVLELECLDLIATPDLASFPNLERLVVRHFKSLVQIDPSIGNLECLHSLEVSNSLFRPSDLHLPSSICNLKALSRLEIKCFKLMQLPENIGELKGLKVMRIEGCKSLRNLPNSIGDLESLCELHLRNAGITELPESIGKLGNLKVLDVSFNQLRGLPATIGALDRLERLDVRHNRGLPGEIPHLANAGITELPESIGKLGNLKVLDVSSNQLRGLPATIGELHRLERLDVYNNIGLEEEIPSEFGGLKSLKHLDMSRTGIRGLPSTIHQLSRLESLFLGHCDKIQELPELSSIHQLSQLRDLSLSRQNPSVLSLLPSGLNSLSLYHSMSLSSWERLSNLEGLSELWLYESSDTEIRLDGLESLKNLTRLEIIDCKFLERIHDISRLQKLQILDFSNCPKLVEIGGLTQLLESLQHLSIWFCDSIRCLPDRSGTESPSELCLEVIDCSKLPNFMGPYDRYFPSRKRRGRKQMK